MRALGFVGGGNMAEALVRGLLARRLFHPDDLIVSDIDPARRRKFSRSLKVKATASNQTLIAEADRVLIAVKPQTIDSVLEELRQAFNGRTDGSRASGDRRPRIARRTAGKLFISIAAGVTLKRLARRLGGSARIIRVMPNAPAMVGQGMAAIVRGPGATRADEAFALRLFRAAGDAVLLEDERLLDAVTALSGSGPAYVYLFVKAMAEAGAREGLPPDLALRMALQTVRGAEQNMRESSLSPAELIRIVASPGGTTEAALDSFAQSRFSDIVARAVRSAAARSRELGRDA